MRILRNSQLVPILLTAISLCCLLTPEAGGQDFVGNGRSGALIYNPSPSSGQSYSALSNGVGGFGYRGELFTPGFDILRACDFNGDGKTDLVVYRKSDALAYIGMGNGDGTFSFQSLFWSPAYDIVECGDINGDGKIDVALYNSSNGTLYTGISNGTGLFTYQYHLVSLGYTFIRLADFTGDGKADLFLYNSNSGLAFLGVGDGAGGFAFHSLFISPGYALADIGDLNGDGKADLLLYNPVNGNAATGISDGAGGFTFTPLIFSPGFTSVAVADYTGDGLADVTLYNKNTAVAYFGTGNGAGNFTFQSLFWSAGYDNVVAGDVNADGKADVILYSSSTGWATSGAEYTGISNGVGGFTYTYNLWNTGYVLARTAPLAGGASTPPSVTCSASPNPAAPGQTVWFTASSSGGFPPYNYSWTGAVVGSGQSISFTPSTTGLFSASVQLTDRHGQPASSQCSVTVQSSVTNPPYNCDLAHVYPHVAHYLIPLADGSVYVHYGAYMDTASANLSDWTSQVLGATLTTPNQSFGPMDGQQASGANESSVDLPPPGTFTLSGLGWGIYTHTANFQASNPNCGVYPNRDALSDTIIHPALTGISPQSGVIGNVLSSVVVSGTGLSITSMTHSGIASTPVQGVTSVLVNGQQVGWGTLVSQNTTNNSETIKLDLSAGGVNDGPAAISLTAFGVTTSNAVTFNIYDATPVVQSVQHYYPPNSSTFLQGEGSVAVQITGVHFGTNPLNDISQIVVTPSGGVTVLSINGWSDTSIAAYFQVSPTAGGTYTVSITSKGTSGNQFQSGGGASGQQNQGSGSMLVVQPLIRITSLSWGATKPGTNNSAQGQMYKQNSQWHNDTLADEGSTLVVNPVWKDDSASGTPNLTDPVVFANGSMASIFNIAVQTNPPITADAKLRIVTDQGSLAFPDIDIGFINGNGSYAASVQSQNQMPPSISNITANLTWSISFDGGTTYLSPFETTSQTIFVTLGLPRAFAGSPPDNIPARNVTAARLNRVTVDFRGKLTAQDVIAQAKTNISPEGTGTYKFGNPDIGDPQSPYQNNPWAAIERGAGDLFDCLSLTEMATVEIMQAGGNVAARAAYATTDADATNWEKDGPDENTANHLDWFLYDGRAQILEEFLYLIDGTGNASEAHTVEPMDGPIAVTSYMPQHNSMPNDVVLAFDVIYKQLKANRAFATSPYGGRQWFVAPLTGLPIGTEVSFPVPIQ